MIRSFLLAAVAVAALSAVPVHAKSPLQSQDAATTLHKLFADEWERGLVESPENASNNGDNRFNDRWTRLQPGGHRQARSRRPRRAGQAARDRPQDAVAGRPAGLRHLRMGSSHAPSSASSSTNTCSRSPPGRRADGRRPGRSAAVRQHEGLSRLAQAHGGHPDAGRPVDRADARRRQGRQRAAEGADAARAGADRRAGRRRSDEESVLPAVPAIPRRHSRAADRAALQADAQRVVASGWCRPIASSATYFNDEYLPKSRDSIAASRPAQRQGLLRLPRALLHDHRPDAGRRSTRSA